ncbi:MAG: hypothetical protein RLZZ292_2655 [Bacteroidota bacterium]|jgi:hypothetical protein
MSKTTINNIWQSARITSVLQDDKIDAINVSLEITRREYLDVARKIKDKNEFQRKGVNRPSTVYALLITDLKSGCIIPAIVLALDKEPAQKITEDTDTNLILDFIKENVDDLKILDGLQRTNRLIDVDNDFKTNPQSDSMFYDKPLRIEIYIGINKFGILYRMLTLNTGQTPMTLRHQIEILFSHLYSDEKNEIYLMKEVDAGKPKPKKGLGRYNFSEMIEGLNAYIDGSEWTMDRFDILTYVRNLESLSKEKMNVDLFEEFILLYHVFVKKTNEQTNNWIFNADNLSDLQVQEIGRDIDSVFGEDLIQIFTKSQVITGFGAALKTLKNKGIIEDFAILREQIEEGVISFKNMDSGLLSMIVELSKIKQQGKKIGDNQRTFFRYFFQMLFDKRNESYLDFEESTRWAVKNL